MTDVTIASTAPAAINLAAGYSSIRSTDVESKKLLYTAITNAESLADHLGETIFLKEIVTLPVVGENERTKEVEEYTRTTFIDADGRAFAAGSDGVLTSTRTLLTIFGEPSTWSEPLAVRVVEKKGKNFKFFTVETV